MTFGQLRLLALPAQPIGLGGKITFERQIITRLIQPEAFAFRGEDGLRCFLPWEQG